MNIATNEPNTYRKAAIFGCLLKITCKKKAKERLKNLPLLV